MYFTILQNGKSLFQAIKTRSSKVEKLTFFQRGEPMVWSKNGHLSNFSFQAIKTRKMSYTILQNGKSPFQAIKTGTSKSRNIDIFQKGLTQGFGPKMAIFQPFFQAIKPSKISFTIFQNKKLPFQAVETRSSKSRKIDIFPKGLTHRFGPTMAISPTFFFQAMKAR